MKIIFNAGLLMIILFALGCANQDLSLAVKYGNAELARKAVAAHADVNAKDDSGYTLLQTAITKKCNVEIVKILVENGADVKVKNNDGDTPLYGSWDLGVFRLLIEKGADVNAKGFNGRTPLHYCHGVEKIELLIANGADVNALDNKDRTPLYNYIVNFQKSLELYQSLHISGKELFTFLKNDAEIRPYQKEVAKVYIANDASMENINSGAPLPLFDANEHEPFSGDGNVRVEGRFPESMGDPVVVILCPDTSFYRQAGYFRAVRNNDYKRLVRKVPVGKDRMFAFEKVPAGKYAVMYRGIGQEKKTEKIFYSSGGLTNITVISPDGRTVSNTAPKEVIDFEYNQMVVLDAQTLVTIPLSAKKITVVK